MILPTREPSLDLIKPLIERFGAGAQTRKVADRITCKACGARVHFSGAERHRAGMLPLPLGVARFPAVCKRQSGSGDQPIDLDSDQHAEC